MLSRTIFKVHSGYLKGSPEREARGGKCAGRVLGKWLGAGNNWHDMAEVPNRDG